MSNIIIASFKQEAQAIAASQKLTDLEFYGDITIYEMVMVKKKPDGEIEELKSDSSLGLRTLSGIAIGILAGAIAGPVGMVVGMFTGTLAGAALDLDYYRFSGDFGSKIMNKMEPGSVAIIAEVDEDSSAFIDNALSPFEASLTRSDADYEYEKYEDEEIEAIDEEIATERAKIKTAITEEKTKIQNKISELKEKRRRRIAELEKKTKDVAAEGKFKFKEFKISRLKNRIEKHQTKLTELENELKQMES
jgi:uncharacterized membrane protein